MVDTNDGTVRDKNGAQFSDFMELEERTSDPSEYDPGEFWHRQDKNAIRFYDGVSLWQIPIKSGSSSEYVTALAIVSDTNGDGWLPLTKDVANAALPQFTVVYGGTEYAVDAVGDTGFQYTQGTNGLGGEKLQHTEDWETNDFANYSLQIDETWENN